MKHDLVGSTNDSFLTRIYLEQYSTSYKGIKDLVERFPSESSLAERNWAMSMWFWRDKWKLDRFFIRALAESYYYRPLLQYKAVEEWLAWLDAEVPILRDVVRLGIMKTHLEACKQRLGDYMLARIPKDTTLTFKGVTYQGIGGIMQADREEQQVFSICKRFPCFDSYDYVYENRYYRNYWFGVDEAVREVIWAWQGGGNCRYIGEDLPDVMLPMVYYEDEQDTMLVAYNGDNPFGL